MANSEFMPPFIDESVWPYDFAKYQWMADEQLVAGKPCPHCLCYLCIRQKYDRLASVQWWYNYMMPLYIRLMDALYLWMQLVELD